MPPFADQSLDYSDKGNTGNFHISTKSINTEISNPLRNGSMTQNTVSSLHIILKKNLALSDKTHKLKYLLSRSAISARYQKAEMIKMKECLLSARREIEFLRSRVDYLSNRPTDIELITDFETNFDRALMRVNIDNSVLDEDREQKFQASLLGTMICMGDKKNGEKDVPENELNILTKELNKTRDQLKHMENLNLSLIGFTSKLKLENIKLWEERESEQLKINNIHLELQMARMETMNAISTMRENAAIFSEMQLEIDLVSQYGAGFKSHISEGMKSTRFRKINNAYVDKLEENIPPLREWVVVSSTTKEISKGNNKTLGMKLNNIRERILNKDLRQLKNLQNFQSSLSNSFDEGHVTDYGINTNGFISEKKLWSKESTVVIGAGMIWLETISLNDCNITRNENLLLRWSFNVIPQYMDVTFSILKGKFNENDRISRHVDAFIRNRRINGGDGDVEKVFDEYNVCSLLWSNKHSWVRPKSVKYVIEVYDII